MMEKFTASNGLLFVKSFDGSWRWEAGFDPAFVTAALRELFLAERDAELGRWRDPEQPGYVVYPDAERDDLVLVLNEVSGFALAQGRDTLPGVSGFVSAARAYFAAHPVRKPWEDAEKGSIWELTDDNGTTGQYLVDGGRFFRLPLTVPEDPWWESAGFASQFVSGRRVWPEGETTT